MPTARMVLGLPIGQHITFKFTDEEGKEVFRPYTPVTDDDTPGKHSHGTLDTLQPLKPTAGYQKHLRMTV